MRLRVYPDSSTETIDIQEYNVMILSKFNLSVNYRIAHEYKVVGRYMVTASKGISDYELLKLVIDHITVIPENYGNPQYVNVRDKVGYDFTIFVGDDDSILGDGNRSNSDIINDLIYKDYISVRHSTVIKSYVAEDNYYHKPANEIEWNKEEAARDSGLDRTHTDLISATDRQADQDKVTGNEQSNSDTITIFSSENLRCSSAECNECTEKCDSPSSETICSDCSNNDLCKYKELVTSTIPRVCKGSPVTVDVKCSRYSKK